MSQERSRDPREVLVREKYFSLRPRPLEQWIWQQGIAPSAERVFWLHWHEGMRSGDWCSALPLKRVAALCFLDVSSVTRAYQLLARLGLIRRQDPGRDPERPFEQAVAITEVRVPRELVEELARHPNRQRISEATSLPAGSALNPPKTPETPRPRDPFEGLSGRERLRALSGLLARLSANERRQYDEALRTHRTTLSFDPHCVLNPEERARVLQILLLAAPRALPETYAAGRRSPATTAEHLGQEGLGPRRLTVFELARLRRDLYALVGLANGAEILRQVVWSVEQGALRRFTTLHATRIALKKIREGVWTRPNRMPPNWSRELALPGSSLRRIAFPESCRIA